MITITTLQLHNLLILHILEVIARSLLREIVITTLGTVVVPVGSCTVVVVVVVVAVCTRTSTST